ncbi:MAG: N-acetylglucosamine-6-phosphate deacetylase [Candidatus Aminicenantes bacterium]|nr:MAG: N-acetylglucosamine-6-phosphate deacetylase [Candidatus Aminicenantes bacterium]
MHKIILKGSVVLPDRVLTPGFVSIEGEKIAGVFGPSDEMVNENHKIIDYGDAYIAPGLVDLHLHGALGKDVMDCKEDSLSRIAVHQSRSGVTGFLGSTMSVSLDLVIEAVKTIKKAAGQRLPSEILGAHVEGPFLNIERKGAQDPNFIKEMTDAEVDRLIKAVQGMNIIISLAPEIGDNMDYISMLKKKDFVVAVGHSDATYKQALESFQRGITHATHLFNAMRGFDHREPGVVGAVLDAEEVTAELITDGIHLHPATLRLVVARKDPSKICLITDSLKATGEGDGVYHWGDREIDVRGQRATLKGTDVLAGSVLTLNKAVKNMIDWTGVSLNQAVNMASLNPAQVLGLGRRIGSIIAGKYANLAILDRDFNVLATMLRGEFVHGEPRL